MKKKILLMVLALFLIVGLTAYIIAAQNQPAKSQTPPATAATAARLPSNQQQVIPAPQQLTDNYGRPMTVSKFGQEDQPQEFTVANPTLGVSLNVRYHWAGRQLGVVMTNNGMQPIGDRIKIYFVSHDENNIEAGVGVLDLSKLKPGESRKVTWKAGRWGDGANNANWIEAKENWTIVWAIVIIE